MPTNSLPRRPANHRRAVAVRVSATATAVALVFGILPSPAAAAGPATDTLRRLFAEANQLLLDPGPDHGARPEERVIAMRQLLGHVFEFRGASARVLGSEWRTRTAAEQDEFVRLFEVLLSRSYMSQVASLLDVRAGVSIRSFEERAAEVGTVVRTAMVKRDGGDILLDYDMIQRGDRWMVRDVVVDGVSLVANYRAQVRRLMHGGSYGDLVERVRAIAEDVPSPAPTTTARTAATWRPPADAAPIRPLPRLQTP